MRIDWDAVEETDLQIQIHDTTPTHGMRHCGLYPKLIDVLHIPTGVRVIVGADKTQMENKRIAINTIQRILDGTA